MSGSNTPGVREQQGDETMMIWRDNKVSVRSQPRADSKSGAARAVRNRVYQLLGAAITVVLFSANAHAECMRRSGFNITTEGPWNWYMTVQQGKHCSTQLNSGGLTIFKQVSVVQSPGHGTVRLQGPTRYMYSASRGYTGDDHFMVKICGNYRGTDSCTNVQHNVTVM